MNKIIICFMLAFVLFIGDVTSIGVVAATRELQVLGDSYTDESKPTENYGALGHMLVRAMQGGNQYAFLKFETFIIKPGDYRIELRIACNTIYPEGTTEANVKIFSVDDSSWAEGKINGANMPRLIKEIASGKLKKGELLSFDVSEYVMDARLGKRPVSFAVVDTSGSGKTIVLTSKQSGNADLSPTLVLDTSKKPQPTPTPTNTPVPSPSPTPNTNLPTPTPAPVQKAKVQEQSAKVEIDKSINIDDYTTTRYAPWMVNLHLTSPEQVAERKKGGEAAQMVWAMGVSKSNPQMLLLGTDTAGIYKSSDGGHTWRSSNTGFGLMGTADIAFDPDDENIAYVLANPNSSSNPKSPFSGVWKSTDGGQTWRQVLEASYYRKATNKLIKFGSLDRAGKRTIYVGTHDKGVYKSSDSGETWENKGITGEIIFDLNLNDDSPRLIAACEKSGLMVSEDGGDKWITKNEGLPSQKIMSIAVNPSNSSNWFVICDNKVFSSKDSGSTWEDLNVSHSGMGTSNSFAKLLFGAQDENGKARLYISINNTQYSLRYSTDYGITWNKPQVHSQLAFIKDNTGWFAEPFAVHPTDPNILWTPLDTDVFKSTDGGENLYPSCSGFSGFRASNFLFDKSNDKNIVISFIDRGLVRSVDYGGSEKYPMFEYLMEDRYDPRYKGQKTVGAIDRDPTNPNHLFISIGDWGANKTLAESIDGGLNFTKIPDTEGSPLIIKYHPQDSSVIYAGRYMSIDGGKTWNKLPYNIAAVSPFNGDVVWARSGDVIYKSLNRAKDWQVVNIKVNGIQNITPDIFIEDRLWIGSFASGVFRADGENVVRLTDANGLVKTVSGIIPIYDIAQDPKNQNHLVAGGTDNQGYVPTAGLFETYDGGQTWKVIDGIEGSKDIWKVAFHPNLPQVYISTSLGTWVYDYDKYFDRTKTMFNDIENHWAKQSIENMSKAGIVKGFDDGGFKPDKEVTRAEFIEMFLRVLKPEKTDNSIPTFADVYPQDWYYKSIETAVKNGYVAGADLGMFLPNDDVTHEQIVTIISRLLKQKNINIKNDNETYKFNEISDWAKGAATVCLENGIISLDGNGAFVPKKAATRAEALVILEKLLKKLSQGVVL